jgi:hypothetical protein
MKEFRLQQSKNTPEITLLPTGLIKIRGRSIHENVTEFFEPVENWVEDYVKNPADLTCVDIMLEYFNSASARVLITLFQTITRVTIKNKKYIFNWYYEEGDDDILERGEYFASVLNVTFNFIKVGSSHS